MLPSPAAPGTPSASATATRRAAALLQRRWPLAPETLLVLLALWWALAENRAFVGSAFAARPWADIGALAYAAALFIGVVALHVLVLAPLAGRRTAKPVYALLIVIAALASFYAGHYGVVLDPSMLRNVLHTHPREAGELIGPALLAYMALHAGVPLALLWRVEIRTRPWRRALLVRGATMAAALATLVAVIVAAFQPLASAMRNDRALRYQITPANVVWSLSRAAGADVQQQVRARQPIGLDAAPGAAFAARTRPLVVVVVVGETARAANWGLSGYARQTTPQLAALPGIVNFAQVTSCGTNTETSLPCMFSPLGRRRYDESTIRGSESLLHVAARAGVGVTWRDNQSGCKGVCDGLAQQTVAGIEPPGLCRDGACLDEGLLHGLPEMLRQARGTQLLVLHQLGNHGPSYFRRYPREYARFQPACESDDLRQCTREQIVNAYDNALLYTDHLLARLVQTLHAHAAEVDSALLYVSDHGESLGENNLYLHGIPYAFAPEVQTRVPMVMWLSDGHATGSGLDTACLRRQAAAPASHDHLFHTVLGLLDVTTALYEPAWDLGAACRHGALQAKAP